MATYRGQSSGWQLGVIVDRGLDQERAAYLVGAVDEATREKIKSLDHAVTSLETQLKNERADRVKVGAQLDGAIARVNRLLQKLADSSGTLGIVDGVLTYVPTGPSPIALLADAADSELSRLLVSQAPRASDPKWLSASHDLAVQIATSKAGRRCGGSAAGLEAAWAATPPNVVHAMLFAFVRSGRRTSTRRPGRPRSTAQGSPRRPTRSSTSGSRTSPGRSSTSASRSRRTALRPGDLLTYGPDGAEHVTMYIGANMDVEAKGRAYGVVVAQARTESANGFAGADPYRSLTQAGRGSAVIRCQVPQGQTLEDTPLAANTTSAMNTTMMIVTIQPVLDIPVPHPLHRPAPVDEPRRDAILTASPGAGEPRPSRSGRACHQPSLRRLGPEAEIRPRDFSVVVAELERRGVQW